MSTTSSAVQIFDRQLREERDYWSERLSRELTPSALPADFPRPEKRLAEKAAVACDVRGEVFRRLNELTGGGPFLTYTVLSAALQVCLARYAGSSTIVVGSPVRKLEDGAGPASDALAIVGEVEEGEPFRRLLTNTRQTLLEAYARQRYPFRRLLADLGYDPEQRGCPLFGVALGLADIHGELPEVGHDVTVTFRRGSDRLAGEVAFDPALFKPSTIERFARHYRNVLRSALTDPEIRVGELEMLDDSERARLAEWGVGARHPPRQERRIHRLVEAQAQRRPDAPAVLFANRRLTYRELNSEANRLARHLRRQGGVADSSLVAIAMDSSLEAMTAILATLKAGAAYVPLDPKHPRERLVALLAQTRPAVLVTVGDLLPELPTHDTRVVCVDREREVIERENEANLDEDGSDLSLAYVIHTSGSTGIPHGVMISHRALVNRVWSMLQLFDLDAETRQSQFASLTFDMSCEEIFQTWSCGGAVVLLTREQKRSGLDFLAECDRQGVTKMNMASSAWHNVVDAAAAAGRGLPTSLKVSVVGAETPALEKLHIWDTLARHPLRFFNIYGPTEGTIMATWFEVAVGAGGLDGLNRLPIGRPLPDTGIHLLDARLRPVGVGLPGEIHIGGAALARGYLDRPALTARKFIPDPWSETTGARLYKTGDLARYHEDGLVEFVGRVDFQVKIRGFRVELGEIEALLRQHPTVRQTVVLAREDVPGDKRLAAYVVAGDDPLDVDELRRDLADRLPEYMVPTAFVELDELPLTPNGKIDRRRLPAPGRTGSGLRPYVAPRTPLEDRLAGIWSEVLGVDRVGREDNFFQLGGHSLQIMKVISRVNQTFEVELALQTFFEGPTVAALAEVIERSERVGQTVKAPPLVARRRTANLPLSFPQQRLWFIDQLDPGNSVYNMPSPVHLEGRLDVVALERTLSEIVRRHEVLRTSFPTVEGQPVQVVAPPRPVTLPTIDLAALPRVALESEARRLVQRDSRHEFDLRRGPLLRASLSRLAPREHLLLFNMHHIVSDGWSMGVLVREVKALYGAFAVGEPSPLAPLPIQYADFALWQRQWLRGEVLEKEIAYWKDRLAGPLPTLELPLDRPRPTVQSFHGAIWRLQVPEPLTAALESLVRRSETTLFTMLLAAFQTLLCRYTGQDDILVGTGIAGRHRVEIEGLIGFFVNTSVIRADLAADPPFREALGRVHDAVLEAQMHQDLPFEKLVEEIQPERVLSHSPLFQAAYTLDMAPPEVLELPDLKLRLEGSTAQTAKYELTLLMAVSGRELAGGIEYNTDLFDAETITRMAEHFQILLRGIVSHPEERLSALPLLSEAERQQALADWNDTPTRYPRDASVHRLFEAWAEATPHAVALCFEAADGTSQTMTYRGLNQRANQLAHHLLSVGVEAEDRVGLSVERSPEMVVAMLAILKAGAAYVPLDPSYPPKRISFMLADAGPQVVLTRGDLLESAPRSEKTTNPAARTSADNLAYVIYTSGSTGKSKGVAVPHRAVVRLVRETEYVRLEPGDRVAQAAVSSFDAATFEIWGPLLNGACLVGIPNEAVLSPQALAGRIRDQRIDVLFLTTALFNQIAGEDPAAFAGVRDLLFGGEAVDPSSVRKVLNQAPPERLLHVYGPTENTTFSTWHAVAEVARDAATVSIGQPIAGSTAYVLDVRRNPVPVGIAGELYLGGDGLARAYLNRPALTAERFVPHPFVAGERLYRTGDKVCYRRGGRIEFLGRFDDQVKIRGFRIEPGEIEALLVAHARVRECAVLVREDVPGQKQLVAYTGSGDAGSGDAASTDELKGYLEERLPPYMVPSVFVRLESLPLNPNGKVDRAALLARELAPAQEYAAPRTPSEEFLTTVFAEVLGLDRVGIHDNFFELGGHSLLATQVLARVPRADELEFDLRVIFESPTVSELAARLDEALLAEERQARKPPLSRVDRRGDLPLSFAQQRLWFLDQLAPGSPFYNLPTPVRLTGRLDVRALVASLDEIERRHEALRTSFPTVDGKAVQQVRPATRFALIQVDLTALPAAPRQRQAARLARQDSQRPFDLAAGPLARGEVLRLDKDQHLLLLTTHHIVSDGWSVSVLVAELAALYEAFSTGRKAPLPPLPIQYADFACWQRGWLQGKILDEQLGYWKNQLRGAPALLELPTDRPRPEIQSFRGAMQTFTLPEELSRAVNRLSREENVTLFMTLLATFQTLLYRYAGVKDVCVGTPIANRTQAETEALIGFFANTLVLRAGLAGRPTFREFLRRVRETSLAAYEHQDVPFEMVVEAVKPLRSSSYSPLFQVMFIHYTVPVAKFDLLGLSLSPVETDLGTSKWDLSLTLTEVGGTLAGGWSYSTDLFDASTIVRLTGYFETLLASVVAHPDTRIDELEMLSETERQERATERQQRREAKLEMLMQAKPQTVRPGEQG